VTGDKKIIEAVKELRKRMGMTQTEFAAAVGKSFPMIRRYEFDLAPHGASIAPFAMFSIRHAYDDLAEVFISIMTEELGDDVVQCLYWLRDRKTRHQPAIPDRLIPIVQAVIRLYTLDTPGGDEVSWLREALPHMLKAEDFIAKPSARHRSKKVS
jgi:transcriptional regulator with XRE-family HTH domain